MESNKKSISSAKIAINETEKNLKKHGISRAFYMKKLKELCDAQKQISCVSGKEANGGTVDFIEVPDNAVQLNAVKEIIMLYGDRAALKVDNTHDTTGNLADMMSLFLAEKRNAERKRTV